MRLQPEQGLERGQSWREGQQRAQQLARLGAAVDGCLQLLLGRVGGLVLLLLLPQRSPPPAPLVVLGELLPAALSLAIKGL